ncbi:unnamed protein product [Effrenium voratum]|nr:unnamed protein product [Effrenium voratum]
MEHGSSSPCSEPLGHVEELDAVESLAVVADFLADMQAIAPEFERAVTAGRALACFARALWAKELRYHQSFRSAKKVQDFWSHSWRTPAWKKVGLLLFWYNGNVANLAGTVAALAMFVLCLLEVLPGYLKQPWTGETRELPFGVWSIGTGLLVHGVFLIFYWCRRTVWLDWICIHQGNEEKKMQGILSLGANIRNSKNMLILWDETWIDRLWCVFELSAFLKSHGREAKHHITILPTFIFPFWLASFVMTAVIMLANLTVPFGNVLYVLLAFLGLLACSIIWEQLIFSYYSHIRALNDRLAHFSLADTNCSCCSRSHVNAAGEAIPCDRKIIAQCMCSWFGSVEACEASVSSTVAIVLREKLGARFPLPYWMLLNCGMPLAWGYMDIASPRARGEEWEEFWMTFLNFATWFFALSPAITTFTVALICKVRTRQREPSMALRWLCRLATIFLNLSSHACYRLILALNPPEMGRVFPELVFFGIAFIVAVAAWRLR